MRDKANIFPQRKPGRITGDMVEDRYDEPCRRRPFNPRPAVRTGRSLCTGQERSRNDGKD